MKNLNKQHIKKIKKNSQKTMKFHYIINNVYKI